VSRKKKKSEGDVIPSKTVRELFPRRFPGHRLTAGNWGCLPGDTVVVERGEFFLKIAWKIRPGYVPRGFANPPYLGTGPDAIVFEKETPADPDGDSREPGFYWAHGNADTIRIVTV
jgi:hypothetical protein